MALMLVFDTKQTLFLWRDSCCALAENMESLIPGTKTEYIAKNYRSPEQLVELANFFAEGFRDLDVEVKSSEPHKPADENVMLFREFRTTYQEMSFVSKTIQDLKASGVSYDNISVLARTNKNLMDMEAGFITHRIPYRIKYDARSIMNKSPFKFMYAIYSLMFNSNDVLALFEILSCLKGIGAKFIDKLRRAHTALILEGKEVKYIDLFDATKVPMKATKQWKVCKGFVEGVLSKLKDRFRIMDGGAVPDFNSYTKRLFRDYEVGFDEDEYKEEIPEYKISFTWAQLQSTTKTLDNIYAVLQDDLEFRRKDEIEKFMEVHEALRLSQEIYDSNLEDKKKNKEAKPQILLTTIHGFKGKESDYIFFTNLRPPSLVGSQDFEEWCCFYVGVTRPKGRLYLTCAEQVLTWGGKLQQSPMNPLLNRYLQGARRLARR
jgi:superfamily I DNA/RNA helicase